MVSYFSVMEKISSLGLTSLYLTVSYPLGSMYKETVSQNSNFAMSESPKPTSTSFTGHSRRGKRIFLAAIVVVIVAVSVALLVYFLTVKRESAEVEVELQAGVVRGRQEGEALVYKGIPYADPPIKERRWKPPNPCEKNTCWRGTFDAGDYGSICAQQDLLSTTQNPENVIGHEDCLFINVWTPKKRSTGQLLPVLVFIHGGFLLYLSGNWQGLHPSPELVVDMNIVGVSFNYRLNAFGFLALNSLADALPSKTSGNYGFMDQILALKWVQANIEKFGGDPKSVTLMGSSSGGTSELALMASGNAAGLFHRAILMSASAIFNKSSDEAAVDNKIFVKSSSCERNSLSAERECLYQLTPKQIQDAIPWNDYPNWRMDDLLDLPTNGRFAGAVAVVDKDVVLEPPLVAMAAGRANDVPLIIGTTAQESDVAPPRIFNNSHWTTFSDYVNKTLGSFPRINTSQVLKLYGMSGRNFTESALDNQSIQFKFTSMVSDLRATCPNNQVAKNASQGFNNPVYRYVVTNRPSSPVFLFGFPATYAFHMWDLVAFFGFPSEIGYKPSAKDRDFMSDLRREFGEFMKKGSMKTKSWKVYPSKTARFTDSGVQVPDEEYHKEQCDFWLDNGFFPYAWIN